MNPELARHYKTLIAVTDTALKVVGPLSSSTYHLKPGKNKWSISQILTHLLIAEKLSLSYMKKKSQTPNGLLGTAGINEDIRFFILALSQQIPVRYKAPKVVLDNTPNPLSFGDLVREWNALRTELSDFLDTLDAEKIRKKIYKHPVAGRLSVIHAVRFMALHINHHQPQIEAIVARQRKKKVPVA